MTLSSRELSLLSNTDVLGYIQAENAARNAQAKAEGWEFWTTIAEEIASEFANVYELELSFAQGMYSDIYKDLTGIKGYVSDELTLEQVLAAVEELSRDLSADMLAEDTREEYWADLDEKETAQVEEEEWEVYETKAEEAGY